MKTLLKIYIPFIAAAALLWLTACMNWDYGQTEDLNFRGRGLFIINEGNFQYSNATLSYYDPQTAMVSDEVFLRANGMKLGDVAQSMTIYNNLGWIVVNHSNVIFAIDLNTFREQGRITGLTSPRYIHFVSPTKAYVTQLWDNRIAVVNPQSYDITGYITVPGMEIATGSTEQIVQSGQYIYVNCWSYQRKILKIDTSTDQIIDELEVGFQPNSLVIDKYNRLWVMTEGSSEADNQQTPALYLIDLATFTVDRVFTFYPESRPSEVAINGTGDRLYWINDDIWAMDVEATRLPLRPIIRSRQTAYYGLTIDPVNGDIYIADAIDYQQNGIIYRYSSDGLLLNDFFVGITPGAFCWKLE